MAVSGLYEPENIKRVRLAQIAVTVLAITAGGYLAATTLFSMHEVWTAQQSLSAAKTEAAELSREAALERKAEQRRHGPEAGGVDAFAVRLANWAKPRGIRVESYTPEGAPTPTDVTSNDVKLGAWNANKVRIKGSGDYWQLVSLLNEFETTDVPVRLESFVLQSSQQGDLATVTFDLLLTVFEKVGPETVGAGKAGSGSAAG
jgi:hypothetical protein